MTSTVERAFLKAADQLPALYDLAEVEIALMADLTLAYGQEPDPHDAEAVELREQALGRLAQEFVANEALVVRKVERYIHVLEAQADLVASFKARAKRLRDHAAAIERGHDNLKARLIAAMHAMNREQIATPSGVASIVQNAPSCVVLEEMLVPYVFKRTVVTTTVDKNAIKAHMKATGEVVPGVEIVRTESLRYR